jgi:hypothetical protein
MSLPVDIDKYQGLLALDEDQLLEQHIAEPIIARVIRLRALYTYWCRFSSKGVRDIVEFDMLQMKVGESQAYDDVTILKNIMGNLQESSKKFWRWRINQMLEEDRLAAKRAGDHRAVASIEKNFIKNNMTDKEDTPDMAYDKIVPVELVPTDDPTVIGIKKIPDLRGKIRKMLRKYEADPEYAQFEEVKEEETVEP